MKKALKCISAFIGGMAAAVFLLCAVLYYEMNLKERVIAEFKDEPSGYTVVFKEVGEAFLFGPSKVKIELKDKSRRTVDSVKDTIHNDGCTPNEGNISVYWRGECVQVVLSGDEQEDETYILNCK